MKRWIGTSIILSLLAASTPAFSGSLFDCGASTNAPAGAYDLLFAGGRWEIGPWVGVLFSPIERQLDRPSCDYAIGAVQAGYMINSPYENAGWFRGNWELAPEAFGGPIFDGQGSYVAGGTLWLRYNFIQRGWRFVPYIQTGGGFGSTDANRMLTGENFNFNVGGSAGTRFFVTHRCSINLEYRFQHTSNAKLADHDLGINAQGPVLGVSWFF